MTLDWEHIAEIIESRGHTGFPTLECEENFFSHQVQIQSTTQPITYEQLMRENFENTAAELVVEEVTKISFILLSFSNL